MIVGANGVILESASGASWSPIMSGVMQNLSGIDYNNGMFVATGTTGLILTSPDGAGWVKRSTGGTEYLNAVASGLRTFLVVGDNRSIYQSDQVSMNILYMVTPSNAAGKSKP